MSHCLQQHAKLGDDFLRHVQALCCDITAADAQALWQDIAARYCEPQRVYHTLDHIYQLFVQFERIKHDLDEPHLIALALYYHDVIYTPTRTDNELKSADYAREHVGPYLSKTQYQQLYDLIMMTASHQLDDTATDDKRSDAAYMLDMDLSILGAPWHLYELYAQAVRQEYAHVPATRYRNGRTALLKALLTRPQLYLTEYYHERLEAQARDNITREMALLAAQ